jgi:hypothetical protein
LTGRWGKGATEVQQLVREGSLEQLTGARADGLPWLARADRTLATAAAIGADDPESAYVLAYDAARHACCSLLAQQGLRATSKGGHYAVEQVVRAQFGPMFREFGTLRRRRNELEYPSYPGERVEPTEVTKALATARGLCGSADLLIAELGLF